ncbi:tetratricopeptide repeat protein [Candidatus Methylocalor cossyra]|uniref:TPR_REGION domain-containing protein n=1 Tax=Candidatus Methylocalor cossyra TaxID=3108543 RepID=A0ABP1C677_9GAMM
MDEIPAQVAAHEALRAAVRLHRTGQWDQAEAAYRELLERHPDYAGAWHYLGVLTHQRGASETGAAYIRRALDLNPGDPAAWNNLGNIWRAGGLLQEAAGAYLAALKIDPLHAEAFSNLGVAFLQLGMPDQARPALVRAIELQPDRVEAYLGLGLLDQVTERWGEAVECYRRAIALEPRCAAAYRALWRICVLAERLEEARSVLEQWLLHDPDNAFARHLIAAQTGESVPDAASAEFIRMLFDPFAASFDFVLRERLDYRAPELVAEAARHAMAGRGQGLQVADLGCGTGLCGPLLKPLAGVLTGVDLSRNMLGKARGRDVYDRLVEGELTAFLAQSPASYDLLIAADTLVYFGNLQTFAERALRALRPGGAAVFTVERAGEEQVEGYRLQPHGRYTHRGDYLDRVLGGAGFLLSREAVYLRQECGVPVQGWLVVARRP